jgi:hypothetical protein
MEDIRSGRELKIDRVEYAQPDAMVSGGQDAHPT